MANIEKTGVKLRDNSIELDDVEIGRRYLAGEKIKDISKIFGVCNDTIVKRIDACGIVRAKKRRKYTLNEKFFDNIDTEEKAYMLGFLFGDGCNYNLMTIQINLSKQDRDLLVKFNEIIGCDSPLRFYKGTPSIIRGVEYQREDNYLLRWNSQYLATQLNNLGCTPRKTNTIRFPNVLPKDLIRHFVRGYFDADGYLTNNTGKGAIFSIASNKQFCEDLKIIFKDALNISMGFVKATHSKNLYYVTAGSLPNIKNICEWLYQDATIYLPRKKQKYTEFLETKWLNYCDYGYKCVNKRYLAKV